jgi:hypothetical protein
MMVITMCSFILNLPGLRLQVYPKVVNWRVGRTFSKNLPAGNPLSTINRQSLLVGDRRRRDAQQLANVRANVDARVSNAEKLIDETTSNNKKGTDDPGSERAGGQIWVIVVVDHSTDLSVGRILHVVRQRPTCAVRISSRLATMIKAASILSSS